MLCRYKGGVPIICILCFLADTATLQKAAATWILKTRESHCIPISVMESIIQDVQSLYEVALTQLSGRVQSILHDAGVTPSTRAMVAKEFTDGTYTHLFTGLNTNAEQMTYYKNNFNFVVSYLFYYCLLYNTHIYRHQ